MNSVISTVFLFSYIFSESDPINNNNNDKINK